MPDEQKVVGLPGVKLNDGKPSEKIVEFLEAVLAEARASRVASVGLCWVSPHGAIDCGLAFSGLPVKFQQVAASLFLLRRAERWADIADGRGDDE